MDLPHNPLKGGKLIRDLTALLRREVKKNEKMINEGKD